MNAPWPPAPLTTSFAIRAEACPQIIGRLLGHFAQRDLVPDAIRSRRWGDELAITIEQTGLSESQAEVVAEKMRGIVTVVSVATECRIDTAVLRDAT